ncbi:Gfo/Idh/MocA family oxidoreductase [Aestuariibacter halophilus]|uniref:Gfo/Idh/MocA family oxidoreductase n=1 Tax=Fluctibacter halophilus TaxID=226011 RepID=A0ABS8G959_9ALTE|nr:Gfo/Idh/MocA family oxidoreductase [Aestuariibacter halophilus]MCC2617063.1 Gfo/Idh/MocA family oxidoreductase [Aestuariibacter halophilus]
MRRYQPPIRWGILGCGDVTEVKSGPAYQQVEGFRLDAVMARTPGKAADFARRHNVPRAYTDADALIDDPALDAIYIATPPDSHCEYALAVAEAGKICCVEKPMAVSYQQCLRMQRAFQQQQLPLFVAYYRRSLPGFQRVKALLNEGYIGEIRHVHWHYSRPPKAHDTAGSDNWRTDRRIAPGGYFDDLASHGLDLLCWLLGPVIEAHGITANQQGLYSACDAVTGCWQHASGPTGSGNWNFASHRQVDEVCIDGSSGSLTFSVFGESPAQFYTATDSHSVDMTKPMPIQGNHVQAMADHLFRQVPHPSTADSALHTNWVMHKILGS